MGKSKGKYMNDRKFQHIDNVVWETTKCILISIEIENDGFDSELFYTPP
jgi:hypothetical protein